MHQNNSVYINITVQLILVLSCFNPIVAQINHDVVYDLFLTVFDLFTSLFILKLTRVRCCHIKSFRSNYLSRYVCATFLPFNKSPVTNFILCLVVFLILYASLLPILLFRMHLYLLFCLCFYFYETYLDHFM